MKQTDRESRPISYGRWVMGGILLFAILAGLLFLLQFYFTPKLELPFLTARSIVVMDVNTGRVLYEKDSDTPRSPASLTKMMSMLLIFDAIDAGVLSYADRFQVTDAESQTPGVKLGLTTGETVTVEQLVAGTILNSGCDCIHSLVRMTAGDEISFVSRMNQEAAQLGLDGTHFANCTGLDDVDHYMTALDIAKLSRELVRRHPEYLDYSAHATLTLDETHFVNTHQLIGKDPRVLGIKTGTSALAGNCLTTYVTQDNKAYLIVLLDSNNEESRFDETTTVINALLGEVPDAQHSDQ